MSSNNQIFNDPSGNMRIGTQSFNIQLDASADLSLPGYLSFTNNNGGVIYATNGASINVNQNETFVVTDGNYNSISYNPTGGEIDFTSNNGSFSIKADCSYCILSSNDNIQMKNTNLNATSYFTFDPSNGGIYSSPSNAPSPSSQFFIQTSGYNFALVTYNNIQMKNSNSTNYFIFDPSNSSIEVVGSDMYLTSSTNLNYYFQFIPSSCTIQAYSPLNNAGLNLYSQDNYGVQIGPANNYIEIDGFGNLIVNGTGTFSSSVTATAFNSTSDYRIKSDVEEIMTTNINKLRPVSYINNNNNEKYFGLIAHELQEYYPELVKNKKDGEQMQTVDYIGLIPLLITEIQRLTSLTEKLANEVEQLKKIL